MELLQNTILKLIFRQGTNTDRKNVVFSSGEPAWTTDTNRLWVGNSVLSGGKLVGNQYQGTGTDVTLFTEAEIGDLAFNSDSNKLFRLEGSDPSILENWEIIGGVYSSGDDYIDIDSSNTITLNPLSANTISEDLINSPISLSAGRLTLDPLSAYSLDSDLVSDPIYISDGKIGLSSIPPEFVSTNTITFTNGLVANIGATDVTDVAVNPLTSSNISVETVEAFGQFNGPLSSLDFGRNITSGDYLSAGYYQINYTTIPTTNAVVQAHIVGESLPDYTARVLTVGTTFCTVKILKSDGSSGQDAVISIRLTY